MNNSKMENNQWSKEEDNILIQLRQENKSRNFIAQKLNKSFSQIKYRIKILNLKKKTYETWSENEDKLLINLRKEKKNYKEISKVLDKNIYSVWKRCRKLGLEIKNVCLTEEQYEKFKELKSKSLTNIEIGQRMGLKQHQIQSLSKKIIVKRKSEKWTENEIEELKNLKNQGKSYSEISNILRKTEGSIRNKISLEKLSEPRWSEEEEEIVKKMIANNKCFLEICEKLNRSYPSVSHKAKRLGLVNNYISIENNLIEKDKTDIEIFKKTIKPRLKGIENNSKQRKIPFNLTYYDIINIWNKQNGMCYYTDIHMSPYGSVYVWSVDRVNSKLPYFKDNIVLCCWIVNKMKQDINPSVFIETCDLISKKFSNGNQYEIFFTTN